MATFSALLTEIKHDCGWEAIPRPKIASLAKLCGPAEIDELIAELDQLDDADLVNDAGDGRDEYWRLRTSLANALTLVGTPAVPALLRALASANPPTRAYAARSLGEIRAPGTFEPLAALLAAERDFNVILAALFALGDLGEPRAVPLLLPFLNAPEQRNRGWLVRVAAGALGKIDTLEVVAPLVWVLTNDPDWFARLGATEGLAHVRQPEAREALRGALQDPDSRVRHAAQVGLNSPGGS